MASWIGFADEGAYQTEELDGITHGLGEDLAREDTTRSTNFGQSSQARR